MRALAADGAGYPACWRPSSVPPQAAAFARQVVTGCGPLGRDRAKNLLWAAGKLAGYGIGIGLEPAPAVLLHPSVIERFTAHAPGLSGPARRTLRTNLRFIARRVVPALDPADAPLPRERAKAPYTEAEIDAYLRLAAALSTERRRQRATALVCLGAGAGVIAGELRALRGSGVVGRADGVLVVVSGRRARSVPVLCRYRQPLLTAARFAREQLICGGREPGRRNVTDELCRALSADSSLPGLQSGRLRSSWLVACAGQIGLGAFMQAAGISCSQRLGDLAAQLPAATERQLVALLGGPA